MADVVGASGQTAEVREEQLHLSYVRECLAAMRTTTEAFKPVGADKIASEMLERNRERRLASMHIPADAPLFFGRIDFSDGPQHFHIGRRHIRNEARDPVVVDWRADIARTFYQAGRADPLGLFRRRRFGFQQGEITGLEDELLQSGPGLDGDGGALSPLVAAEIERPRTGPMRDIVATIQPDQDEIVRASLDDSVCVQGGPGTGKTAVGLHRAAYLLYAFEPQLRSAGVLVVGPNQAFMQYVNQVLPALGEIDVDQMPLEELLAAVPVRGRDYEGVAAIKQDLRMAEVIRRAVDSRMGPATQDLVIRVGVTGLRLEPAALERVRELALRRGVPYEAGRSVFRDLVADHLLQRAEGLIGGVERTHVIRALREAKAAQQLLDGMWPKQDPVTVVHTLLTDPGALDFAAEGLLDGEEQRCLLRPGRRTSRSAAAWSRTDLVLIDEAAGIIARPRTYGHVVVDEAQDLSPMQLRAAGDVSAA